MLKKTRKLFALILTLSLVATCIPTAWAAQAEAPKTFKAYYIYQYGSGGTDCLEISSNQVNTKGAVVHRTKITKGAANQQVVLTPAGNGYYYVHWLGYSGAHSGRDFVLDQNGSGVVTQYTRIDGKDNQLWRLQLDSKTGAYRLQNKKSGLYLTYQQSSNGYVITGYKGNSTQLFQFYPGDAVVPAFLKATASSNNSSGNASIAPISGYNRTKALEYAASHWQLSNQGLCAEFVSNCLRAGGLSAWAVGCTTLHRQLMGTKGVTITQLNVESNGSIRVGNNRSANITPGDLVLVKCEACNVYNNGCTYTHVVMVSEANDFVKVYARNNAVGNQVYYGFQSCGYANLVGHHTNQTQIRAYLVHFS